MPTLKVLPPQIANMIAAGEVVQRPASVVKELVENAVDAGASKITVVISDAGRTLIQVLDDGCGMSAEDAGICFERHATSKIESAGDLESIMTYGFRGEALPSIAAVSEVTLKTRREQDETASQVEIGALGASFSSVSAPKGTSIAVRNLFYNTPARRKFLKSDSVEFKHIVEEFNRVALTRPHIAFTLMHNGRDVFVLKAAKTLKFRVMDLMGSSLASELVDLEFDSPTVHISGFIGRPDTSRKFAGNQYFFVNGRFFRSAYLGKAVLKAYEGYIPDGLFPSYFINLEVSPGSMDVNIHPTKTEIKFEDDAIIFQILYACVKETLGKNAFGSSIDFEAAGAVDMPAFGKNFDSYHPVTEPSVSVDSLFNPFDEKPFDGKPFDGKSDYGRPRPSYTDFVSTGVNYGALFEQQALTVSKAMVLGGRYVASPVENGLMVVNIRRALERTMYESFLKSISTGHPVSQASLFPVTVEIGVEAGLTIEDNLGLLRNLGFDITMLGEGSIVVSGVPDGYSCEEGKIRSMVSDLLLILSEGTSSVKEMMDVSMAQKLALLGASSAKTVSSPLEAQSLVDNLLRCQNPEQTPSGHRILTVISFDDLDQKIQ